MRRGSRARSSTVPRRNAFIGLCRAIPYNHATAGPLAGSNFLRAAKAAAKVSAVRSAASSRLPVRARKKPASGGAWRR